MVGIRRGFEHRVEDPEVAEKFFSKVLKISRIFRFDGHCVLKNATLSTGCYPIMVRIWVKRFCNKSQNFSSNYSPPKAKENVEKSYDFRTFYVLWLHFRCYSIYPISPDSGKRYIESGYGESWHFLSCQNEPWSFLRWLDSGESPSFNEVYRSTLHVLFNSIGYNHAESWKTLIRRNVTTIAEAHKIPISDLQWYAAFHDTGHHPHIHLMVYSKAQEGHLSKKSMAAMKCSTLSWQLAYAEVNCSD